MRSILSVSLPADKKKEIEERAKKAHKSTSSYILYVFELEKQLISETEVKKMADKAEKDYKTGKTKRLNSLTDLIT